MTQQRKRSRPSGHRDASLLQGEEADLEEDSSMVLTQTATQVQRNLEKRSPEQVNLKVSEVVQYLLVRDQKKLPIKRADIVKNVVKEYKDVYPEILIRAKKILQQVFGFQLEEIDTKTHVYILTNKLERVEGDDMRVDDGIAKLGLLTVILSLIFMKGNTAKESAIWETLRRLHIEPGYLEYIRIPHTEPAEYEFRWGSRAYKETSKMKILEFVSKIQQKDPKSWSSQYKEAQEGAGAAPSTGN
ncbi:hypothetical protein FKM82_005645 [Ascaphus truei]